METTSIRVWNNETFPTGLQGLTFDIIFISIRTWTSCANGHGTCNPIQDIHPSSLSNRWMWCWRNSSGSSGLTTPRRREFFSMKKVNLKFGWTKSGWFRLPWMIGIHPALSFPSFFSLKLSRLSTFDCCSQDEKWQWCLAETNKTDLQKSAKAMVLWWWFVF